MSRPLIDNRSARRLFLARHGLSDRTSGTGRGADLLSVIQGLGFVQLDSVNTFARAHDLILWSRRHNYQPDALGKLFTKDRALFEHWTHDASVLPIHLFPHWRHRFDRNRTRLEERWTKWHKHDFMAEVDAIRSHITTHGPCTSSDVGPDEGRKSGGWWDWHPSKTALEYLWQVGEVSVVRRDGFSKVYDLTENVIPATYREPSPDLDASLDWGMNAALDHLGFANAKELRAFHQLFTPEEVKRWVENARSTGQIAEVTIQGADGLLRPSFMRPGAWEDQVPAPLDRIRILSPFDPALRDRDRAERLFGFAYRIEMFVPAPKRRYGYYVFPVLEGDRIIGRIDMKADRAAGQLNVTAFWPEVGIAIGKGRLARLQDTLDRAAVFGGCDRVVYAPDWLRSDHPA